MSTETERLGSGRYIAPAPVPDNTETTVHSLVTHDGAAVRGVLRMVPGASVVCMLMHPRQDFTHHVLVPELLNQGYAVWTQNTRTGLNDLTLLHEQALLDMAAGQRFLRNQGYDCVVSVGHSGGAALAAYYIEQASLRPDQRFADAPDGKPVPLPQAEMPVPDGLMLMAPHPGQGQLLQRVIDPSVADENDPLSVVPSLDPYNPDNGFQSPPQVSKYSAHFISAYRQAQRRRIERIDAVAWGRVRRSNLARYQYKQSNVPQDRRAALASGVITVFRTDADLRSVDLSIDANERPYGSLFGKRPDLINYGIVGFGRLTTPAAWLSTWSALSSRASMLRCAPGVSVPVLLVEVTGDQACFPADAEAFAAAFPGSDVSHVRVRGRHFGGALEKGQTSGATLVGRAMTSWLGDRFGN